MNASTVVPLRADSNFAAVDDAELRRALSAIEAATARVVADFIPLNYLPGVCDRAKAVGQDAIACATFRRGAAGLMTAIELTLPKLDRLSSSAVSPEAERVNLGNETVHAVTPLANAVKEQLARDQLNLSKLAVPLPDVEGPDQEIKGQLPVLEKQRVALGSKIESVQADLKLIDTALHILSQLDLQQIADDLFDTVEKSAKLSASLTGEAAIAPLDTLTAVKGLLSKSLGAIEGTIKYIDLSAALTQAQQMLTLHRDKETALQAAISLIHRQSAYLNSARELELARAAYQRALEPVLKAQQQLLALLAPADRTVAELKTLLTHFNEHQRPLANA